ncbi:MAG: Polysaccharide deacetylase [Actinomycetia bacterium]|nr:Polysaccharide deacetylase [Actinomycetes bacterium]
MAGMERPAPEGSRSDSSIVVRIAVASALVGFLLAVEENSHLRGWAVLFAGVAIVATYAAHRLPSNRTLAVIGAAIAATSAWLLPQRDDVAVTAVLVFLFALGAGLAVDTWVVTKLSSKGRNTVIAALVVAIALFLVFSQGVLLVVVVLTVLVGTAATLAGRLPARTTTRPRALAFGAVLVVSTLLFTAYIGAETPAATWFGGGAVHGPTNTGQVALTFDDGPNLGSTEKIMAILDAHGVKGTFFEVGKAIDAAPAITRALFDDGQLLGNHSYNHDQWRWLDPRYPELQRTQAAFERAIGTCPVLYRPPHGDRTPFLANVVRDHHMHMVLWSASAGDWATNDAALVARRILANARPGAILLLHDGLDGNPEADRSVLERALPLIIDGLRAKGLSPVRLDRLLGTEAYQPC